MTRQLWREFPGKTPLHVARRVARSDSALSFQGGLHPIAQLQGTLGNRRVAQLIQAKQLTPEGGIIGLRRKLTVGAGDDQYEQQADRMARQVMIMPNAVASYSVQQALSPEADKDQRLQTKSLTASITPFVQRQMVNNEESDDKEKPVQAKLLTETGHELLPRRPETEEEEAEPIEAKSAGSLTDSFEAGDDVETQVNQSKGRGSLLPDPVRTYMEPRFGVDFSYVHAHTGSEAIHMNRALGAQAFAHGSDIYFGEGHKPTNLELTAHELTHVVQQTGGGPLTQVAPDGSVGAAVQRKDGDVGNAVTAGGAQSSVPTDAPSSAKGPFSAVPDSLTLHTPPMSVMDAPGNQSPAQQPAPAPLSKDERTELIRLTGNRITRAFVAFTQAVEQNRAAVKAAASDSSGFLDLILEIALGVLLPAISKGIAHLAEELPANASNFRYKVALQAMKEEQTTKLLETGVKFGKEFLKGEASALAGEDEMDAFLGSLEDKFNLTADKIDQGLPNLSDEALGVMAAAYDPTVAGREQFRAAVKDLVTGYQKQVKPIGTTEYHWMNQSSDFGLYYVVSPTGSKRLALLESYYDFHGDLHSDLKTWISPELRETAIERFKSTPLGRSPYTDGKVPEIPASAVGELSG